MRTKFENKSYDPTGDYWFNLISLFIFFVCGIFGMGFIFIDWFLDE
jgi:hypothetical protein